MTENISFSKKKTNWKLSSPFPVITTDYEKEFENDSSDSPIHIGYLNDECVLVYEEESIIRLYSMGFFGKGTQSRGTPKVCLNMFKALPSNAKNVGARASTSSFKVIELSDSSNDSSSNATAKKSTSSENMEVVLSDDEPESVQPPPHPRSKILGSEDKEFLLLSFEEAYFLSFALGCLVVLDKFCQPLNLTELWKTFCTLDPEERFPVMYVAYHFYRSNGWVVKSGIKYGVNYVLYKDGPPFNHASYSVIVNHIKDRSGRSLHGNRQLTWHSLSAISRVNTSAGKNVVILNAIKPTGVLLSDPNCICHYKVQEYHFSRWVPSANRIDQ